jgi:hypothetical protein
LHCDEERCRCNNEEEAVVADSNEEFLSNLAVEEEFLF